ncbi:MAG: hypothetical protein AMXMBFR4_00380 [Candidatus Hydrogenedentota bacterium]
MNAFPFRASSFVLIIHALTFHVGEFTAFAQEHEPGNRGMIMRRDTRPPEPPPPPPEPEHKRDAEPPPPPRRGLADAPPDSSAWAVGLNEYFETHLANPTPDEVLGALVTRMNRATLAGTAPGREFVAFSEWLKTFRRSLPKNESETKSVEGLYRNVSDWVALESEYHDGGDRSVLKRLVRVVQSQAELDPGLDPERRQRIINTIEKDGLFVPAGILFGYSVLPYRNVKVPAGYVPLEVPVQPRFVDVERRAMANYDFLEAPGPIFRVDFDTLHSVAVRVEQSADGQNYSVVQEWTSQHPGGVRGPVILQRPFRARYARVTCESQRETAILRNPRIFALKEPAAAICPSSNAVPVLDASFKEKPWPLKAQIDGFVNVDQKAFAESQTTVRIVRTSGALYIGAYCREARMDTMAAGMDAHDAPLWDEESFEVRIRPEGGPVHRFIVNPRGARFESRDGEDSWDGEWSAVCKSYPLGWAAEIEIPFATLGARPSTSDWRMDCARVRHNVAREHSVWAYGADGPESNGGLLIFE